MAVNSKDKFANGIFIVISLASNGIEIFGKSSVSQLSEVVCVKFSSPVRWSIAVISGIRLPKTSI
ncbi:MAG: hypothetical protein FWG64_03740 [Firmicutes bacterium]|nr:hypothetical protein [Bacillota bacterium]